MVGVNCYEEEQGKVPTIELHRIDPSVERDQVEGLRQLRAKRDAAKAKRALDDVRAAAKGTDNLLERFIAAAHADCTIGEIAEVLRECWGEYKEPRIL
jgi:methylmalonyl-CoA mutase N-terminal domain/subunit